MLPGAASADDECLELVSMPAVACSTATGVPLCESAALMSLADVTAETLISTPQGLVSIKAPISEAIALSGDLDTIRFCPPGSVLRGDSCHVRPLHEAPPDQGGGAVAPTLDPWLLHTLDSNAPDRGRPLPTLAGRQVVHPGFGRAIDRPPRPRAA